MRRHYKTKLQWKRDLVGGVLATLAGTYLLQSTTQPVMSWLLIVAGGCLIALVIYAYFLLPQLIYRYQPKLKFEYRLRFADDGIAFQTDEIDSQLKWSIYHSWLRDAEFYILYHGIRDISVIPRRVLDAHADERLAAMLCQNIGDAIQA